jgi:hypothetical protein
LQIAAINLQSEIDYLQFMKFGSSLLPALLFAAAIDEEMFAFKDEHSFNSR